MMMLFVLIAMDSTGRDLRLTTIVVISVLIITSLIVIAVDDNSVSLNGYSAVLYSAAICLGIQWLAWIPASLAKSERYYDLTGGLTYLTVVGFTLWAGSQSESPSARELIVSLLVVIWALRLSSFLYLRIHRTGKDGRFDRLKTSQSDFSAVDHPRAWVFLPMIVVIVINSQASPAPELGIWDAIGLLMWLLGFSIEVIADNQKSAFNANSENQGKWIDSGLWSYSRHPNYFGEIMLWTGIACFGISCFSGLERVAWVSPIFIYLLLTKISGVPILDRRGLEKWGDHLNITNKRRDSNTSCLD
ncbi:MAG: hypothetical protein CM15mP2_1720 [Methanobacteriota archaeon]|nr:MAG: hypothetical protein CM15mP2_1720 [Euryarchaeota archaeon]